MYVDGLLARAAQLFSTALGPAEPTEDHVGGASDEGDLVRVRLRLRVRVRIRVRVRVRVRVRGGGRGRVRIPAREVTGCVRRRPVS